MTEIRDAQVFESPLEPVLRTSSESKGECEYAVRGHNFSPVQICTNPYGEGCPDRIPAGRRSYCGRGSSEGRVA